MNMDFQLFSSINVIFKSKMAYNSATYTGANHATHRRHSKKNNQIPAN